MPVITIAGNDTISVEDKREMVKKSKWNSSWQLRIANRSNNSTCSSLSERKHRSSWWIIKW